MRKVNLPLKYLIIAVLFTFTLATCGVIYAKSENASPKSSGKGNSEEVKEKENQGKGSENKEGNKQNNEGKGSQGEINKASENKGKGKIQLIESKKDEISTKSGKLTKLEKVVIKEATASAQGKRRAVHGIVTSIEGSLITLVHQIHRDRVYQVQTNANTLIKSKDATASASLVIGVRIVAVGDLGSDGVIIAKRIHIIPGKATGIFRKNPLASSSALPSPSTTASPSASPEVSP